MPAAQPSAPVPGFELKFAWHAGAWEQLFNEQIRLIRLDIQRAKLDGKIVVYLSCPLSGRGGGHAATNVEIARFTERRLLSQWGERFWILNPAQYQMESKEGSGLLDLHAQKLGIDLAALLTTEKPGGGDYMRMWTKVLVEESEPPALPSEPRPRNLGLNFDGYYFLGPSDVHAFFGAHAGESLGASIEAYFARKHSFDRAFRDAFSPEPTAQPIPELTKKWEEDRRAFLVYYSLRASANASLGSHDEWVIFRMLNLARRKAADLGIANQIAGFYDGKALPIAAGEADVSLGYATR